jgi:hypothetical protein
MLTTHPDALIASDYVICAMLRKVADVFSVELLWQPSRRRPEGITLLEALQRCPRTPPDRQRKQTGYSHIIVRIPERDYVRDDRLEDGLGRLTLLRELQRLHQQELGDALAERAAIRYRLEPDPVLRAGEVQFVFGRAIYLPTVGEQPAFQIQAAMDKDKEPGSDWRDVAPIYPDQRLTLLNGDRRASSIAVTAWPFPGGESVLLVLRSLTPALVDVVAEPPGGLILNGDGEGGFSARDRRGRGLRLRVVTPTAADTAEPVAREPAPVRIAPEPPPALSPPIPDPNNDEAGWSAEPIISTVDDLPLVDRWGRREPVLGWSPEFDPPLEPMPEVELLPLPHQPPSAPPQLELREPPGLDQRTWIPQQATVYLRVMGIALQRLSAYATAGLSDWRIGFNPVGGLVPSDHPDAAAWLRVDNADRLFGEVVGLATLLDLPGIWQPFPTLTLEFYAAPTPMTTHYLGWVRLPEALALPVPHGKAVSFGRGSEADIAPRLLADPRSLRWDGNAAKTVGINAEYLGLSRRHLRVQARRDDWWIQVESQNMPVFRLTASGELLDVLSPGVNTVTTAKPGELLVAGGYVLALGAVS